MRPLRFAVTVRTARSGHAWREKARRVEALGYDTLVMPDHVVRTSLTGGQLAPVPALMAAADATTRLRVGGFVFDNDFRNPVMLAKEMATLDVLSRGRVDVGLGAGWLLADYESLGIALDPPGVRVDRLEEAVGLITRLFAEERVDHTGRHYRVRGARVLPRPLQRPHPPFVIGGTGPRVLGIAGRHADVVSINTPPGNFTAEAITDDALAGQIDVVRQAAGTRFDTLGININSEIRVTDDPASVYAEASSRLEIPVERLRSSPFHLYGDIGRLRERVLELRQRHGLSYVKVQEDQMELFAQVFRDLSPSD